MKFFGFATMAVACISAPSAFAASVSIVSDSAYTSNDFDVSIGDRNVFDRSVVDVGDTNLAGTSYSTSSSASGIGASASGSGSVDIDSGLIRSRSEVSLDAPANTSGESTSTNTTSRLTTTATAVTSGTVTVNLAVDGLWDLTRDDGSAGWQVQGSLVLGSVTAQDSFVLNGGNSDDFGFFETMLSLTFLANAGTTFSVTTTLLTQILSATEGLVDFSNTAALTFETDVELIFSDTRVLTNLSDGGNGDGDPSVVPVPAGLPLLTTALLGLAVMRQRKRTIPVVG